MSQIEKRLLINLIKKGFIKHDKSIDIKIDRKNCHINSTDDIRYLPDTSIVNGDCFTVSKFDGQNIIYTKRIYNKKSCDSAVYIPDNTMKEEFVKTLAFFNNFYRDVQVIHMVEGSFSKNLASSKDISNDLEFVVKNEIIRFSVDGSLINQLRRKIIDNYKTINILSEQDFSVVEKMFQTVTDGINNEDITFSLNQPLDVLKSNLVLSDMLLV
jgi:hypothetical protein